MLIIYHSSPTFHLGRCLTVGFIELNGTNVSIESNIGFTIFIG
jgi:hypothetical protein